MNESKLLKPPPVYDGSGSMTQFLLEVKEYNVYVRSHKYGKILELINIWLSGIESSHLRVILSKFVVNPGESKDKSKIKLKSLLDFKNIPGNILSSDPKFNIKLYRKYYISMCSYFNISMYNDEFDSDEEEMFDNLGSEEFEYDDIIMFIKKILKTIGYSFKTFKKKEIIDKKEVIKEYFSIKDSKNT